MGLCTASLKPSCLACILGLWPCRGQLPPISLRVDFFSTEVFCLRLIPVDNPSVNPSTNPPLRHICPHMKGAAVNLLAGCQRPIYNTRFQHRADFHPHPKTPGTNNGICICKHSASYGFLITSWGLSKTGKSTHAWGQITVRLD